MSAAHHPRVIRAFVAPRPLTLAERIGLAVVFALWCGLATIAH